MYYLPSHIFLSVGYHKNLKKRKYWSCKAYKTSIAKTHAVLKGMNAGLPEFLSPVILTAAKNNPI